MSPQAVDSQEMCIPADEACDLHDAGIAAMDYVEAEMKENPVVGLLNPGLEGRVKATKRRMKALRKKLEF